MAFFELFEVGVFNALLNWSNPILTAIVYAAILIGILIQLFLHRKYRGSNRRWSLLIVCVVGVVISECAWHMITGWERLGVDVVYGAIVCIMLGALLCECIVKIKRR